MEQERAAHESFGKRNTTAVSGGMEGVAMLIDALMFIAMFAGALLVVGGSIVTFAAMVVAVREDYPRDRPPIFTSDGECVAPVAYSEEDFDSPSSVTAKS